MKNRLIAYLTAAAMLVGMVGCGENAAREAENDEGSSVSSQVEKPDPEALEPVDLSDADNFSIHRRVRESAKPMGKEGTWTIFVYICGADLESGGGAASMDMQEMLDASTNENVRFVVETGGADAWQSDISNTEIERYEITGGEAVLVDSCEMSSMGEGSTLADFLQWGVAEYPAANMGLVLWNHGGGSISGVCFDETEDNDSLLLKEVDAALYSVYDSMTEPFEFIGFDACLMSTVEAASLLATHANYMIASQESEPGYGWNYTAIGDFLTKNPQADGEALGKVICDTFYEMCEEIKRENAATLAVIDLHKVDDLILAFHEYAKELYSLTENGEDISSVLRQINSTDNFGGNNRSEGYTNMVDLGGMVDAGKQCTSAAAEARKALDAAVLYQRNGSDHAHASGLSVYYPLQLQGSMELRIFTDICISPYYLGLVDKVAYGAVNADISEYHNDDIFSLFSNDWSDESYDAEDGSYLYELFEDDTWEYADDFEPTGESEAITFAEEPALDEDGVFGFTLTEDALELTDYVEAIVYSLEEDGTLLELGISGQVSMDWETGEASDIFDGNWFCLTDGQLLAVYLVEECDGYDVYTTPILLNGEETNLRFVYDYENEEAYMIDVWDGIDESGFSARGSRELTDGDEIVPLYTAYVLDSDEEYISEGDTFIYAGDDTLEFWLLPDGEYLYSFCINDIFGDFYLTEDVSFYVEGEDIFF